MNGFFHALKLWCQSASRQVGNAELVFPTAQHFLGSAPTGPGVDRGGAADGAAERNTDEGVAERAGEAVIAIEHADLFQRAGGEVTSGVLLALFEDDHAAP